ncbi:hypothetical protein M9H77_17574 [Catharanthus roseus]|uniref:Uncharacterized protein n=1 Tax=Catharanthus roseus TaxID=4058 RepID=A0ACC0B508_CATRO|nr:hypothetical protein M9H77_17574 [Catharanthus roseus]
MKLSMVEESPQVKELSHTKIEKSLKIHVVEEISKEEPRCIMRSKDKGRNMEKELDITLEDLLISLSLNPSLMWHEVCFVELELFLASCLSHVSIIEDTCAISFVGAKLKGELVENCDFVPSFLYASMKNFDGFIPSIQLLCSVIPQLEFPYDEQKVLIVDEFLKTLLLENIHGFQFYHFHFKEFM